MKQHLIVSIFKSLKKAEYAIGPHYILDRPSVMKLVTYLKSLDLWNYAFLNETNALISGNSLSKDLQILDPVLINPAYSHYLNMGDVNNHFTEGMPPRKGYKHLSIAAESKNKEGVLFRNFLYKEYHHHYI